MHATKRVERSKPPGRFEDLVQHMPPQAITDDVQYETIVGMIDRVMSLGRLTRGQSLYLETLVQLVQVYESAHHAIDVSDLDGVDALRHLLRENGMSASDLARLLRVHASMGSKILKGERALTIDHVKRLAERFKVSPGTFID